MDTVRVLVGDTQDYGGRSVDRTRPVEFEGELLATYETADQWSETQSLYRIPDGYVVHIAKECSFDVTRLYLVSAVPADLDVRGKFEFLGRAAGMARVLGLQEGLRLSEQLLKQFTDQP